VSKWDQNNIGYSPAERYELPSNATILQSCLETNAA